MVEGGIEMPAPIKISVEDGKLVCKPNQGNVQAPPEASITWECDPGVTSFVLHFAKASIQGNAAKTHWPFTSGSGPASAAGTSFNGTLKSEPGGVYKYTVQAQSEGQTYFLDPMIIVSK